jgi:hypothetical protein
MAHKFSTSYIEDSLSLFRYYKKLAEGAMEQVTDTELFATLDPEMNSIAIMAKHMAGNMGSRWTDFLTSDGEKPNRNHALEPLSDADLARSVTIRGEPHSVMQAINRQIAHYSYHCGQIVFLAKHWKAGDWKSLSVPRNQSEEFHRRVRAGEASQR